MWRLLGGGKKGVTDEAGQTRAGLRRSDTEFSLHHKDIDRHDSEPKTRRCHKKSYVDRESQQTMART